MLSSDELQDVAQALVIGGEALAASRVAVWRECAQEIRLINEYGPTETVVGCSIYEVSTNDQASGVIPIGYPIANTQLYILDRNLQPVPIGVTGELSIGGVALARGYVNRPDLTAERFIAHPFGKGERLYCTGDLARYRSDGSIEYLGRIDGQVKLRGFRIELDEIEAVLQQHPAVDGVVVLAHEGQTGEKQLAPTASQLVAYVVGTGVSGAKNGQAGNDMPPLGAPTSNDLHTFLQAKLPDYMVPSLFVILNALPLSPNGKLDRRALPALTELSSEQTGDLPRRALPAPTELSSEQTGDLLFAEPRTQLEKLLAQIWMRVLGRSKQVGIHDNFFALGGHSLLATQVISHKRLSPLLFVDIAKRQRFVEPLIH